MEVSFEGKTYNAHASDHFAVEEAILVNGLLGWVNHTTDNSFWLVDENDIEHHIFYSSVESVYRLYRAGFMDSNGKCQRFRVYNWRGAKNKLLKQN